MKYSTQHKYQCSEAYEKWALKNIKNVIHKPTARQAYMAACRTCIEGCNPGNGSEWISVDDRLPADTGIPYKRYFVRHINRLDPDLFWTGAQYWVDGKWDIENVTHWMPLPEPPIAPATGMMFIDENSSPMLRSAFEKGKEEGIKEGMERAAEKLISRARNDPLIHDNTPIGVLRQEAKAIRMELHGLTDEDLQMSDIERENK